MQHQVLPIPAALSSYIANALYFRQEVAEGCAFKMVPRMFSTLFFVLEKKQTIDMLYGRESLSFKANSMYAFGVGNLPASFHVLSEIEVILVHLHPCVSRLFHQDDAHYSTNLRFDISDIDQENKDLNEKLACADGVLSRWQLIQDYLLGKLRGDLPQKHRTVLRAIELMHRNLGHISVNKLSDDVFTCRRNLHELFMQYIGFSPKKYTDIIRFNSFVKLYAQRPELLSDIATQCGYHDLSHLNKDFMRYLEVSPTDYFENFQSDVNNWCEIDYLQK